MNDTKFEHGIDTIEELVIAYVEDTLFPIIEYNRIKSRFLCDRRGRWIAFEDEYEVFMDEYMEEYVQNLLDDWGVPDNLLPYIDIQHLKEDLSVDIKYEEWITKEFILQWISDKCNDFVEEFEGEEYQQADESASEFYEKMSDLLKDFNSAYLFQ